MNKINTRKALNPAYRKHKPLRKEVNNFITELANCLKSIKIIDHKAESEEHFKEPIKVFLQNTFYKKNYINTKERIDLAIYNGNDINSDVSVLIEVKRPSNKSEFLQPDNLNKKALQELLLYYLRERVDNNNNNIKHLIATNGYQWYLFKSEDFYNYFFKNKALIKEYEDFNAGNKDSSKNELFYNEIASKYIDEVHDKLPFVFLDFTKKSISDYNDADLNTLFKIFSDIHLLGADFGNDSNQLNKEFYNELLHIIGLTETKVGGKKLIERKEEKDRDYASILENVIFIFEDRDYLRKIKSIENTENKLFDAALQLALTWINRILFLKLLESQLLAIHNNAKEYKFLNTEFIKGYDDLNDLFFSALAKKPEERHQKYKEKYQYIPYLNSSLFERNKLEEETFEISKLNDDELSVFNHTVLKDNKGNRISGKIKTLEYLFRFLDAYDFTTDGIEGIEDGNETKTLINASVLGLIFEKINGYKEGSFYTPGYITMYMCRETLRRAVVQKFKEQENNQIETFEDLQSYTRKSFKKEDLQRFNNIINSLKIVDPAVGSGHFLVSALNELISIKNDLGILIDTEGLPLQCEIIIDNDELFVTDKFGHLLDYKPENKETANIQKTLFHEKQFIIENCLFGVDINPNSVKICRLRLWIELLKNAYYIQSVETGHALSLPQLQTLPNIDINIKTGNSLISRFDLQDDLKSAFKGKDAKYTLEDYKNAVAEYKNTNNKLRKEEINEIIETVKNSFKFHLTYKNTKYQKLNKLKSKFYDLFSGNILFEPKVPYGKQKKENDREKVKKQMEKEIKLLENEIDDLKNSNIYNNAFEWRFEFPEVLDNEGNFLGFDVVIGNPPYFIMTKQNSNNDLLFYLINNYLSIKKSSSKNIFPVFIEKGTSLINKTGFQSMIVPEGLFYTRSYSDCVLYLRNQGFIENITTIEGMIFDEANIGNVIFIFSKSMNKTQTKNYNFNSNHELEISTNIEFPIIEKIYNIKNINSLQDVCDMFKGMVVHDRKKNIFEKKSKKNNDKFLLGNCISKWSLKNVYFSDYESLTIIGGTKLKLKHDIFPRILIRRTGDYLCCAFLEEKALTESTLYSCWSKNIDIENKYILSLLHSKLFDYIIKNKFITNKQAFPQILMTDLQNLPILIKSKIIQQHLISVVNQILSLKKENPEADTKHLEDKIDLMVYKLYELEYEEAKIIDPELEKLISEEDYNSKSIEELGEK